MLGRGRLPLEGVKGGDAAAAATAPLLAPAPPPAPLADADTPAAAGTGAGDTNLSPPGPVWFKLPADTKRRFMVEVEKIARCFRPPVWTHYGYKSD